MTNITLPRATVEQALEALKYLHEEKCNYMRRNNLGDPLRENAARLALPAITTLRAALEQQAEPVEPVAWEDWWRNHGQYNFRATAGMTFERAKELMKLAFEVGREAAPPQQAEPVQDQRCRAEPRSDGDFVCDCKIGECPGRSAEPAQEPVAWRWGYRSVTTGEMDWRGYVEIAAHPNLRSPEIIIEPLYTAPPQRVAQQAEPVQEPIRLDCSSPLVVHPHPAFQTTPPKAEPVVPLTDEEILKAIGWERAEMYMKLAPNFPVDEAKQETLKNARAVERAVWEKNHG